MPTVLFADADRELRDSYVWLLSTHGFQVETADDSLECLAKLRRFVPNLLILDLHLPWGGGDGVLGVIRDDVRLHPLRVVLTGAGTSAQILDGLASPPQVQTLVKPFRLAVFLEYLWAATSTEPDPPANGTPAHGILVVDDDPGVVALLQTYLRQQGFRVWTAGNGEEALEQCRQHGQEVAVVLLDVQMPHLDGLQTLECLRRNNPDLAVCFMTAAAPDQEPNNLLERGPGHLFRKPFHLAEVGRIVRQLAMNARVEVPGRNA